MRRSRRGFVLLSALAVVLLFAFASALAFLLVVEGDRRLMRKRGERQAFNLAESAAEAMERRFTAGVRLGPLAPLELGGGRAWGEMTRIDGRIGTAPGRFRIRAVGEAPVPGGTFVRRVIVIEGIGDPRLLAWQETSWRWGRAEERGDGPPSDPLDS